MQGVSFLGICLVSFAVIAVNHAYVSVKSIVYKDVQSSLSDRDNNTTYEAYTLLEDDVPLEKLTEEDLEEYVNAEDGKLFAELDILSGKAVLEKKSNRPRRWITVAGRALFSAGRALMRTLSRGPITSSAGKITRQFNKPGDYQSAVRDFNSLKPSDVTSFTGKNGLQGVTGKMGDKYTIQVRSSSSNGKPTLEIFQNGKPKGSIIRKIRYGE